MMFKVMTQQGQSYQDEIEFAVLKNEEGQMGILKDHIPIIVHIKEGYLKLVMDKSTSFLVVERAVVEFKDNLLTVLALEAQIGANLEKAEQAFADAKKERLDLSKRENIDFSKQERELKENITKGKAGRV